MKVDGTAAGPANPKVKEAYGHRELLDAAPATCRRPTARATSTASRSAVEIGPVGGRATDLTSLIGVMPAMSSAAGPARQPPARRAASLRAAGSAYQMVRDIETGPARTGSDSAKFHDLAPILADFFADRRGGNPSGGQQQRLHARACSRLHPKTLLLDEPTESSRRSSRDRTPSAGDRDIRKVSSSASRRCFALDVADRLAMENGCQHTDTQERR